MVFARAVCFAIATCGIVTVPSSAREKPHYVFLLPDGYTGWIQVISNARNARQPVVEHGNLVLTIDDSGVFRSPTYHTYYAGAHDEFFYQTSDSQGRSTRVAVPSNYVCPGISGLDSCYGNDVGALVPARQDAFTVGRATVGRPGSSEDGNSWFLFIGPPDLRAKMSIAWTDLDHPEHDPTPGRIK